MCAIPNWWHSNHRPNNNIVSNLASINTFWIVHCALNSIWRGSLHSAKITSSHTNVKLRRLWINPIFNQPKHHFLRSAGQIVHSYTCIKPLWKYIHKRPWTMVLSALYLASTTSLIIISAIEPSRLQRKLQEQGWT